jgi:glycosidase
MKQLLPFALATCAALGTSCADVSHEVTTDFKPENHVAEWKDEIIYQVLVDRFADGLESNNYRVNKSHPARYHGGDWKGLADKLDYVQALGVTALWITPIVRNVEPDAGIDSYHGYWTQDPFLLNPHFGNLNELRELVQKAHARNIKIVLDIVTNHMGQMFFYDINQNGRPDESVEGGIKTKNDKTVHITEYDPDYEFPVVQSFTSLGNAGPAPIIFINDPSINRIPPQTPEAAILARAEGYHRRGRIVNYDEPPDGPEQTMFGDFPGGLKDVATERQDVRDAMFKAYARWIELADLDGFRIDTVKHVEHEFWQDFAGRIRARAKQLGKDKFLLFGEVFSGDDKLVGSYTNNNELDGLFDFPQYFQVFRDVFIGGGATKKVEARWAERATNWSAQPPAGGIGHPPVQVHVNFLDNHDVGRFLYQASVSGRQDDARAVLHNALAFLLTEDGIPCIYYGTEQDFSGGNDPSNREDLWLSGYNQSGETFRRIARLNKIRKAVPAIRRGDMTFTWTTDHVADESDAGILAFERKTTDGSYALVVINTSKKASTTEFGGTAMKVALPEGQGLVDVLPESGGQAVTVTGGAINVTVPATSAMVLLPEGSRI